MTSESVDKIARAVLYEGYLLYPYRPSALKNQQRWNFGVLYPAAWAANQTGHDRSYFQMECVAECAKDCTVETSIRFLHLVERDSGDRSWQEAIEREVTLPSLSDPGLTSGPYLHPFSFPADVKQDGSAVRRQFRIDGEVEIGAVLLEAGVLRVTLRLRNATAHTAADRNEALLYSLASAHAIVRIRNGAFVSQVDPPEHVSKAVASCQNTGVWPVLVGDDGVRDTMLGSPIILYDYPQIAPESKGDLFDGTEIDEILVLRILTLTDEEKEELRRSDARAREILERLEASPPEHLLQLHGTMRSATVVPGVGLKKGDRVRLHPQKRADIFDTLLEGKIAIIEAVEEDFERNIHFAVVIEDDPGRDLGEMRQAGHRFFFASDEVEPVVTSTSEET